MAGMLGTSSLLLAVALLGVFAAQAAAETSSHGHSAPKCKSRYTPYPCPKCNPNSECLKVKCEGPAWPGFATVTIKGKKCFGRTPITYIAVSYGYGHGAPVCADNKKYSMKSYSRSGYGDKNSDKFTFKARCGSYVKLYLQDKKLYNTEGGCVIKNDPCSSKCDKKSPCNTCGPYKVHIKCPNMCKFNSPPPKTPTTTPPPKAVSTPPAVRMASPPPRAVSATPPPASSTPPAVRMASPPPKATSATPPPASSMPPAVRMASPPPRAVSATPPPASSTPPAVRMASPPPRAGTPPPQPRMTSPPPKAGSSPPSSASSPPALRMTSPPPKAGSSPPSSASSPPALRMTSPPPKAGVPPPASSTPPSVRVGSPPPKAGVPPPLFMKKPPPPKKCPKNHWQSKCPYCIPHNKGCISTKCSQYDSGIAKVTMKGKKCFDKPVSYIAINYEYSKPKCADNKSGYKKRNGNSDKFEFYAKCGSYVDLYLQDENFSNQDGPVTLPFKNPCQKQCHGFKPCTLCGKYSIQIKCHCKTKCGKNCWKD